MKWLLLLLVLAGCDASGPVIYPVLDTMGGCRCAVNSGGGRWAWYPCEKAPLVCSSPRR